MSEQHAALRSALADDLGASLRVLGRHDGDHWTIEYLRDDLKETYDTDAVDDIADDLALSIVGVDQQEDLYDLGAIRATVRIFEDGVVVHVPTADRVGYLVSVDHRDGLVGRDVVATVREHAAGTKR
jgi:hypothetical protein